MTKGTKTLVITVAILAFAAGIAVEYGFLTYVWPNRHQSYSWVFALRNHAKPGQPVDTDQVLKRKGYALGYSYDRKAALWVSYILTTGSVSVNVERYSSFFPDRDIPEQYRAEPDDFVNTGYDKGHQAPSASIDFSEAANRETFALSNVTLQAQKLNRQAWSKLEGLERDWTETKGKIYVVTGPIYDDNPKVVNGIPVPDRYYKVIYAYEADKAIGFIFPNRDVENANLWRYSMPVSDVEEKTGYTFFSNFSEAKQRALKDTKDLDWWQEE